MTVTIWHNPRCSKSRQTLALLQEKGVTPTIREYLKQPPSKAEVETLLDMVGGEPAALIRDGEAEFKALGKKKAEMSKADIVKAIVAHPDPAAAADRGRGQEGRHRAAAGSGAAAPEVGP